MGKRKRHDYHDGALSDHRHREQTGHEKHKYYGEGPVAKAAQDSGLHMDRSMILATDPAGPNGIEGIQPDERDAQVHVRKHKKHQKKSSGRHEHAGTSAPNAVPAAESAGDAPATNDHLDDYLIPVGASRYQRKRWLRKLVRKGLMPKEARADSSTKGQNPQHESTPKQSATPWTDKPIGRKALARQLATTSLMLPPSKKWDRATPRRGSAPTAKRPNLTPWQRSAHETESLVLPGASVVSESDARSLDPGATQTSGIPVIQTTYPEITRSLWRPSTTLRKNLGSALLSGLTPQGSTKRHSFSSKANSVPTHSISGDPAENFRRFSAAAHGRAVDASSDESSETSEGEADEEARVAKADTANPGASREEHASVSKATEIPALSTASNGATLSDPISTSKSADSVEVHAGYTSGSEVGVGRTHSAQPASSERQEPALAERQTSVPFVAIDDDSFDAHQAIDDVFRNEMELTRELSAGKTKLYTDLEREDLILTPDSSDRRVMLSALSTKQEMSMKRIDSAVPYPGSQVFVVQSLAVPDVESAHETEILGSVTGLDEDGAEGDAVPRGTNKEEPVPHRSSSSALSDLGKTPSPPPETQIETDLRADGQHEGPFNDGTDDEDTIAVAIVEHAPESKKKRKMTGRTSKHFSTPQTKRSKKNEDAGNAAVDEDSEALEEQTGGKRKRSSLTRSLLAETKKLLKNAGENEELKGPARTTKKQKRASSKKKQHAHDGPRESAEVDGAAHNQHGDGDLPGREDDGVAKKQGPEAIPRSKTQKQSQRSGGTITDLDASNIIESRSRYSTGSVEARSDEAAFPATSETLAEGKRKLERGGSVKREANPKKRPRRSGGTITDLTASNIIDSHSRHSTRSTDAQKSAADQPGTANTSPADDESTAPEDDAQETDRDSRPRKRARRSGGAITDLDASNIIDSRSRRGPSAEEPSAVELKDLEAAETEGADAETAEAAAKPKRQRKSTGRRSVYFIPDIDRVDLYNSGAKKGRVPAGVSTAPVPSTHSDRFGVIQEKLWQEPFWLLIAVTFLNKTAGRAAAPIFWELKKAYPTPEALANANQEELCERIWHLGLQTQRSKRLISMAKAWVEVEPVKGVRYRTLHYPTAGDGKTLKKNVPIEEDADEIEGAIEIGRIPGCGPYAWDSWRIFCRDVLRGVAKDYNGKGAEGETFVPEWQRVVPGDKELRACLRWMWLREGWIWDHETGDKRPATEDEMARAVEGEMPVGDSVERKFAVQAAQKKQAEDRQQELGHRPGEVQEDSELSSPPLSERADAERTEPRPKRGVKRTVATPEAEEDALSDNIVVESPPKKRRKSGRKQL